MEEEKNRTTVEEAETVEEALEVSIWDLIEHLDTLDPDSEEYKSVANTVINMYDSWIRGAKVGQEGVKATMEHEDREAQRKHELEMKKIEERMTELKLKQQQKQHTTEVAISAGVGLLGTIISLIAYGKMFNRGLKFEETGTFTSTTFRNLFGKFKFPIR